MQCERLIGMIKTWYLSVKNETMAPARMVSFMEQHVASCPICKEDLEVEAEISKITEIILPESKIPKAVRQQKAAAEAEKAAEEEETSDEEIEDEEEKDEMLDDEEEDEEEAFDEDEFSDD